MALVDPAVRSMEHIFAPLREQWVWDFFFESADQEADMLHYAVSDDFLALADFDIATRDSPDAHAQTYRVAEKHRVLLLPSFSTGHLSVGFGVNERITSSSTFRCRERYTGRFVRDDRHATTLFIAEDYNVNMVEVSFFRLISPTRREHTFMLFHCRAFRAAIASIHGLYDHGAVRASLMYHYTASEGRACPTCARHECGCALAVTTKKHPLDRQSELSSLVSYTGEYGGVASLALYSKGENVFLARYNATSGMNLRPDFGVQQKLALWALCAAACKRKVDPCRLIMAEAAAMKDRTVTATDTFLLGSLAGAVVDADDDADADCAVGELEPPDDGVISTVSSMLADGMPPPGIGLGAALAQVSAAAGISGFDVNAMFSDVTAGGDLDFLPVVEECDDDASGASSHPVSTVPSDDVAMTDASDKSATPPFAAPLSFPPPPPLSFPPPPPPPPPPLPQQQQPQQQRRLLQLAPAAATGGDDEEDATAQLDERRRKAELRKARNRESAQRSNMKRKVQIQKLREEIDAASTREAHLRAREKLLREENMSLRTAVFR